MQETKFINMLEAEKYHNIHPGKIIRKRLEQMSCSQQWLSHMVGCKPQEINAIILCKRSIPLELSLKIEKVLGMEEGFLAKIQLHNQIRAIKEASSDKKKSAPQIRKILFWDCDFNQIEWDRSKDFVLKRVNECGSEDEKNVIREYYGLQ